MNLAGIKPILGFTIARLENGEIAWDFADFASEVIFTCVAVMASVGCLLVLMIGVWKVLYWLHERHYQKHWGQIPK